ncbi:MAG: epsilon-lactone hydrolase [Pseudonocardiales bacterium]|nr:epsilon-lactone hydrolase [Pseudonocardiales bacterium]
MSDHDGPAHPALTHSPEFRALLEQLRARPFAADVTPVPELREGFERFAAGFADPPKVDLETVDANGVSCEWARPPGGDTRGAVLYLHGGGFTIGSVPAYRDLSARLAVQTGCAVLTVEYRRAPENRFPAALDDAVAAYRWLTSTVEASSVVVAGDSAGGGLSLSTGLVARDRGLGLPAGLVLISPLADLAHTGRSVEANAAIDPVVTPAGSHAYAERYLGPDGDPFDPLASPLFADLAGLPPTYVQVGTAECLLDDSLRVARRLRDAGVPTELDVWPDMIHILPFFASRIPEAAAALDAVVAFVRARTGGGAG